MSTDLGTPNGGNSSFAQPVPPARTEVDVATARENAQVTRHEPPVRHDLAEARRRADLTPQQRYAEDRGGPHGEELGNRKLSAEEYSTLTYEERIRYAEKQTALTQQAERQRGDSAQSDVKPPADEPRHRVGDLELSESEWRGLAERHAAEQSKKLTLPPTADAYEVRTSQNFKPPAGVEFRLSPNDPQASLLRQWAHRNQVPQDQLSELVDIYAGSMVGNQERIRSARDAEIGKLGATAGARVDAIDRFFRAVYGEADAKIRMARIFTADDVRIAEKEIARHTGDGASGFTHSHRGPEGDPRRVSSEQYEKMSYSQRLDYARQFQQPETGRRRP